MSNDFDSIIIGAGPAGLSTATYAASEGKRILVLDRADHVGGQIYFSRCVENYLGVRTGINGRDLMLGAADQAIKFGADIRLNQHVTGVAHAGKELALYANGETLWTKSIVCAIGLSWRKLDVPGVDLVGVHYGAEVEHRPSDRVIVLGGGNSAGQLISDLSRKVHHVAVMVRGDGIETTMSQYIHNRLTERNNVGVLAHSDVIRLDGTNGVLDTVTFSQAGRVKTLPVDHLYVMIGAQPQTEFLRGICACDDGGFLQAAGHMTTAPGVFCIGDVRAGSVKRLAAAVGEGAAVVPLIHQHLSGGLAWK